MADFMGFTFGEYNSVDLGITRVSGGDRFEEELSPEIKDRNVEVPGLDGEYYFGSDYGPKEINIEIAFDSMTEGQFRDLRRAFNTKKTQSLIFDERPYKQYMAKLGSPIELSYVCFDEPKREIGAERNGVQRDREKDKNEEKDFLTSIIVPVGETVTYALTHTPKDEVRIAGINEYTVEDGVYSFTNSTESTINVTIAYAYDVFIPAWKQVTPYEYKDKTERIYKGEGKITFTCYFPFARSVYKVLPQTEEESDWAISSGILKESEYEGYDIYDNETGIINIYNGGDLPTGFRLYIPEASLGEKINLVYWKPNYVGRDEPEKDVLVINEITLKSNDPEDETKKDIGVLIDTTNQLIVGVSEFGKDNDGNAVYKTSGNLYNEFVESGYFFKLEPDIIGDGAKLQFVSSTNTETSNEQTDDTNSDNGTNNTDDTNDSVVDDNDNTDDTTDTEPVTDDTEPSTDNDDSTDTESIQIFYDYLYF